MLPLNTSSLRSVPLPTANRTSIVSIVFAQHMVVMDGQTDRQTDKTIHEFHDNINRRSSLAKAAMWLITIIIKMKTFLQLCGARKMPFCLLTISRNIQ